MGALPTGAALESGDFWGRRVGSGGAPGPCRSGSGRSPRVGIRPEAISAGCRGWWGSLLCVGAWGLRTF